MRFFLNSLTTRFAYVRAHSLFSRVCIETASRETLLDVSGRVFPAFVNSVDVKREREAEGGRIGKGTPPQIELSEKGGTARNREQRVGLDAIRDEEHQIRESAGLLRSAHAR